MDDDDECISGEELRWIEWEDDQEYIRKRYGDGEAEWALG